MSPAAAGVELAAAIDQLLLERGELDFFELLLRLKFVDAIGVLLGASDAADAVEKRHWYSLRWKIEVFHKILKSGRKAEDRPDQVWAMNITYYRLVAQHEPYLSVNETRTPSGPKASMSAAGSSTRPILVYEYGELNVA